MALIARIVLEKSLKFILCKLFLFISAGNACQPNPCERGLCSEGKCLCQKPYSGEKCQYGPCNIKGRGSPCENFGFCEEDGNNFICHCRTGSRGKRCETVDFGEFIKIPIECTH